MSLTQGNKILASDSVSIYDSFNTFIGSYGGTITQFTATQIPTENKKIELTDLTQLDNKIQEFKNDTYLSTKEDWWVKSNISSNKIIEAADLTNINTTITNFESVKCRNEATNNKGVNGNCCNSNNKSVSCNHSSHSNCCNSNNNSVSCNHSSHSNCCNSNNYSNSCGHGSCTQSRSCSGWGTTCSLLCAQNVYQCAHSCVYGTCTATARVNRSTRCSFGGNSVLPYQCYQNATTSCQETCAYNVGGATNAIDCNKTCTQSGTCTQTCSQSCANANYSPQTCGNKCNKSCANANNSPQTCNNTCDQTCNNSTHGETCANTKIIDITCIQATKSNT